MGGYEKGKPLPGTKWIVGDEIGRGGMGIVLHVSKEPAILGTAKIITPELARCPDFRARFFEEARIQASLRHKHIAQVIDYDTLDDGTPFFVMERLNGKTLGQLLREGHRFEPKFVHDVMTQVLEGLYRAHTHEPPIVHRDIKPENIFVHVPEFDEPVVKILDYGIAKLLDGSGRDRGLYGTLGFSSPEQLTHGEVSPKTDLFSAALVLFILLAGRGPFDHYRDERRIARALLEEPAPSIRDFTPWVPDPVVEVIAAALSKDPDARPRDAYHFIAKLFALTWAGDDRDGAIVNVNTTTPDARTMATATSLILDEPKRRSTVRGMTVPPLEGAAPEVAPPAIQAEVRAFVRGGDDTEPDSPPLEPPPDERLSPPAERQPTLLQRWRAYVVRLLTPEAKTQPLLSASPPGPPSLRAPPPAMRRALRTARLDVSGSTALRAFVDPKAPTRTLPSANDVAPLREQPSTPGGTSRSIAGFGYRVGMLPVAKVALALAAAAAIGVGASYLESREHGPSATPAVASPAAPPTAADTPPPTPRASEPAVATAGPEPQVPAATRPETSDPAPPPPKKPAPLAKEPPAPAPIATSAAAPPLATPRRPAAAAPALSTSAHSKQRAPDDDRDLLFDPATERRP